jgi:serine phosphatase RsbU (regulator of sigma subunit)
VTDERRAANRLDVLDRALVDGLTRDGDIAFAVYDTDLRYRVVSRALADLDRIAVDAYPGKRPTDVLPPGVGESIESALRKVLGTGKPHAEPEMTIEEPDSGQPEHQRTSWLPLRGAEGDVVGALAIVTDLTEQAVHDAALRLSQRRTARLQRVTMELAQANSVDMVREAIVGLGRLFGASNVEVRLLDVDRARHARRPDQRRPLEAEASVEEWPPLLAAAVWEQTPYYANDRAHLDRIVHGVAAGAAPRAGERAWVALPMMSAHGALGGIHLSYAEPHDFDADDRALLQAVAGQCTLAIERATARDREHEQVIALQRALLPAELPKVPGLEFSYRYLSGTPDTELGGDWYDAFVFPDDRVGIVVGDVIGKGLVAAAGMGRVRAALRALALTEARPRAVLTGLDRLFDATEIEESLTTLIYAVIDPAARTLVMADAGHLPLLVVSASGVARYEDAGDPATPLGWSEPRCDREITLAAGDIVIGFSDGLVENRDRPLGEGLDTLLRVATEIGSEQTDDVDALLEQLLHRMLDGYQQDDDVTLLGVRMR